VHQRRTDDNDFHGKMPWGYCGSEIFNGCRAAEVDAAIAERLNAMAVALGGTSQQEKLEEALQAVVPVVAIVLLLCFSIAPVTPGIVLGLMGFIGMGVNYFAYLKLLEKGRQKYAYEIMQLAKEISEE